MQFWCFFTVETNQDNSISLYFLYYLPKYKQMAGLLTNQIVKDKLKEAGLGIRDRVMKLLLLEKVIERKELMND